MLSAEELSQKIAALADQRVSLNDFEDWFRDQSRNVHLWGDENLNEFVDAVESLFSERYFEHLDEKELRKKLQAEGRHYANPFASPEPHPVVVYPSVERSYRTAAAAAAVLVVLSLPGASGQATTPLHGRALHAIVSGKASASGSASSLVEMPAAAAVIL